MSVHYRLQSGIKNTFFLGAFLLILALVSSTLFFSNQASAAPGKINYQGRLTDAAGAAKPDGQYNMKFRIYDTLSGGSVIWSEVRETTSRVTVTNGQFNVQLGDVTPIPPSAFASDTRYFEIELPTPATATCSTAACGTYTEGAMTPRQPVASSAYALTAQDSNTLDGLDSTSFASRTDGNDFMGVNSFQSFANFFGDTLVSRDSNAAFKVTTTGNKSLFNIDTVSSVVSLGTGSGGSPSFGNKSFNDLILEADATSRKFYSSYTTGSTAGATSKIVVYMGATVTASPNNKFKMAIYSGTASTPTTLVAATAEGTLVPGWNALPISATLAPNTSYWLGFMSNTTGPGSSVPSYSPGGASWVNPAGGSYSVAFPATNTANFPYQGTRGYAMQVDFVGGTNPTLTTDNAGRIGIGTTTPDATLAVNGDVSVQASSDRAFSVQSPSNTHLFTVDTVNSRVHIGSMATDYQSGAAIVLVLDSSDLAGDPTGKNGAMYYNTTMQKFRCYQNGAWQNCVSTNVVTLANDVINNNATLNTIADVTGLSFPVVAGQTYRFSALINYTAAVTTTGSRWAINGPTSPTTLSYTSTYTTTAIAQTINYASAYDFPTTSNASSLTVGNIAKIDGMITPSASGTVTVRFASEIANSAITAKAGSTLTWW